MKNLILLVLFVSEASWANTLSLSDILKHQTQNSGQSEWVENKVKSETLEKSVSSSVWLTDVTSSLERKFDVMETFTGDPDNFTRSLPWTTNLKQRTPYGLRFNLEYYRELDDPTFRNFFQNERLRGSLEFSLMSDFLGKSSKKVLRSQGEVQKVFEKKVKADLCLDIAQKYIDVVENQGKLSITSTSLRESEKVLKRLSKAVERGALNKSAQSSMMMDVNSLRSEQIILSKDLQSSIVDLEQASGVSVGVQKFKELTEPKYKVSKSKERLAVLTLKQEIISLEGQLANLKLTSNQDVFLYGGHESSTFSQNTINVDGGTEFNFLGVQAELKFGDSSYKNEKSRLSALLRMKEYELERSRIVENKKEGLFLSNLKDLKKSYKDLKNGIAQSNSLDKRSYRNFYNGKTKYFEFLSTRNQIFKFKRSIIDTKSNFWKVYLDYLYLNGSISELCTNGGGL